MQSFYVAIFCVPENIYNKYKEIAKNTGHSFNGLVISAMHYALDNMEEIKTKNSEENK